MNEMIFDKDLETENISDNIRYIEASITNEINPIVEYDANCLKNNLIFTSLDFNTNLQMHNKLYTYLNKRNSN